MTRLGNFWKFLATNSPSKVAQKIGDFWAILKTINYCQIYCGYYLGNFWKHLGHFFNLASGLTAHHSKKGKKKFILPNLPSLLAITIHKSHERPLIGAWIVSFV